MVKNDDPKNNEIPVSIQVYEQEKVQLSSSQSTTYAAHWVGAIRWTKGNSLTGTGGATTGASESSYDGVRESCLSGLCSVGSNLLSAFESSVHKKGETNGNCGATAPQLPLVSPFLCTDDSKADNSSSSSSSSDSSSDISSGSSSDSSSVHSLGQSHSGPSTRVVSPRLVDPSVRTPRCSDAFMRWRSAPLSTLYPPTTSESSPDSSSKRLLDSSSPSTGPYRKRCRSPTTLVPSSTTVLRLIAPVVADLPPHKRFKDSYSSKVSGKEHMEMGTANAETVAYLSISEGVGAHTEDGIDLGVEVATSDIREDEDKFEAEDYRFKTAQRQLKAGQLEASRERVGLADRVRSRTMTITHSGMTPEVIDELINRRVEEVLAAYEETRAANAPEAESQSQNGSDGDNGNGGNENGVNRNGGNGNPNENDRDVRPVARECTYQDFMKC
nr:hypothetical protein [Tanacetum cinerariifolium]